MWTADDDLEHQDTHPGHEQEATERLRSAADELEQHRVNEHAVVTSLQTLDSQRYT